MENKNRLIFLDNLKLGLTFLVILHHLSISFGGSGSWYISLKNIPAFNKELLTFFTGLNQSYFMSFFFFISAYFLPPSLSKKGGRVFFKERFTRLGLPIIFYIYILNPLLIYSIQWWNNTSYTYHTGIGPLWFLAALLIFSLISYYIPLSRKIELPKNYVIILYCLFIGIITFFIRLVFPVGKTLFTFQLGYFPLYIVYFTLGQTAFYSGWIESIKMKNLKLWAFLGFFLILAFALFVSFIFSHDRLDLVSGGTNVYALLYSLWEPLICTSIILVSIKIFAKSFNKSNWFIKKLVNASYTAYIIHPVFCVWVVQLLEIFIKDSELSLLVWYIFASILTIFLTYTFSHILKHYTFLRKIL